MIEKCFPSKINNDTCSINSSPTDAEIRNDSSGPILYKKRWFILLLFTSFSFSNAYQWIHLSIVSDRVMFLWNASLPSSSTEAQLAVNWLSMIFMLSYVPLIIPAMWFLEHKGLRSTSIIACLLNALGAWLKCFSVSPDGSRFAVLMAGQTLCAVSQIFILGIPAHLAAVWFGANEVSTATSLGVFGNQLGIGFGFAIPSYLIPNISPNTTVAFLVTRFNIMFYSVAVINTVLFILVCIFFRRKPKLPPSWGQILISERPLSIDYRKSLKTLIQDMDFDFLVLSYGINTGIFYAISTVLNEILIQFFKGDGIRIGISGFVLIVAGVVAAAIIGIILDKSKQFKKVIICTYFLSLLSFAAFTGCLFLRQWSFVFITITFLGFFMTGYLPIGFEIAAEITYPQNEGLTSGLLNLSAQTFGLIFTYLSTILLKHYGVMWTNISLIIFLVAGSVLTTVMKVDLKRQKAHNMGHEIQIQDEAKDTDTLQEISS